VIILALPVSPESSLCSVNPILSAQFGLQLSTSNLFFHRFKTYVLRSAEHWADAVCTGFEMLDSSRPPGKAEAK
jgi:hypothetical protein